jgi:hypothetical protein
MNHVEANIGACKLGYVRGYISLEQLESVIEALLRDEPCGEPIMGLFNENGYGYVYAGEG